jgi:hypothetical protein
MHISVLFLKIISRHFSYEHHKLRETSYFSSSLVMNTANYVKLLTLSGVKCMHISLLFLKIISRHFSYEHHKLRETSYFAIILVTSCANSAKLTLLVVKCLYFL